MTGFSSQKSIRRLLLPASLLLNLFLLALIGGHVLRTQRPDHASMPSLARALANAEAVLSPADAAAFGAIWQRDAGRYGEVARRLETARITLEQTIVAEPYDKEAVQRAFDDWQADWGAFMGEARGTLIDALAQISPEGRRTLVEQRRRAMTSER